MTLAEAQEYANNLFMEVYEEIGYAIGLDDLPSLDMCSGVVINKRLTNAAARCCFRVIAGVAYNYYFDVSKLFFQFDYEEQRNIVAHEWVHAMCGPNEGHGPHWKSWVNLLNSTGYFNITTYCKLSSANFDFKYRVRCKKCGAIIGKNRMINLIKYPGNYTHTKCGGTFERMQ